jgi:hypothetical protein
LIFSVIGGDIKIKQQSNSIQLCKHESLYFCISKRVLIISSNCGRKTMLEGEQTKERAAIWQQQKSC